MILTKLADVDTDEEPGADEARFIQEMCKEHGSLKVDPEDVRRQEIMEEVARRRSAKQQEGTDERARLRQKSDAIFGHFDADADGTPDFCDGCPNDPLKTAAGDCGCGFAESTVEGDRDCDGDYDADDVRLAMEESKEAHDATSAKLRTMQAAHEHAVPLEGEAGAAAVAGGRGDSARPEPTVFGGSSVAVSVGPGDRARRS